MGLVRDVHGVGVAFPRRSEAVWYWYSAGDTALCTTHRLR